MKTSIVGITYVSIFLLFYALLLRLAAKILATKLQWRLCLQYSFLAVLIAMAIYTIGLSGEFSLVLILLSHLGLGTAVIGKWGANADGNALGWKQGLKITALSCGLWFAAGPIMGALYVVTRIAGWGSYTSEFTREKPLETDIIGRWKPVPSTICAMKNQEFAISTHAITLTADHGFTMSNIPDCWHTYYYDGDRMGSLENCSGQWKLELKQDLWWMVEMSTLKKYSCSGSLTLLNLKPPYRIALRWGDPDGGRQMVFERETGLPSPN